MTTRRRGMSFVELVLALSILSVLTVASHPLLERSVQRTKETQLRQALGDMRAALDRHYRQVEQAGTVADEAGRWPASLQTLVDARLLRCVPVDPITGAQDWVVVPRRQGEANVFDVRSASTALSLAGRPYGEW